MLSIAERARQEADAVEAAEATEAPDTDTEPDTDPEPVQPEPELDTEPSAQAQIEKATKALAKEDERHAKRVAEIMGEDFALVHSCPACADFAAGFTLTDPDAGPPVLHGEQYEACGTCNGYGVVLTGALTDHGRTQTCTPCAGQGYVTKQAAPVQLPPPPAAMQQTGAANAADVLRAQGYMVIDPPTSGYAT